MSCEKILEHRAAGSWPVRIRVHYSNVNRTWIIARVFLHRSEKLPEFRFCNAVMDDSAPYKFSDCDVREDGWT